MSKPKKPQEKLIHIKAESECYSVYMIVPEKKAVSVLEDIRDGFSDFIDHRKIRDKLTVQTCVHNPTLF